MPAVVFLTAYDQFAIRAFDAEAHDYLVKPVSEARFSATIRRLVKRLGRGRRPARASPGSWFVTARREGVRSGKSIGSRPPTITRGCGWAAGASCCASRSANWSGA